MTEPPGFMPNAPRIGGEVIDGEAIVIDFVTGAYYSLVEAGAIVWTCVTAGLSLAAIVDAVLERYEGDRDDVEGAVLALCRELETEQLIVPAAPAEGEPAQTTALGDLPPLAPGERPPFAAPQLAKYTDMEQLLLLDPVHEVDDAGWPAVPTE